MVVYSCLCGFTCGKDTALQKHIARCDRQVRHSSSSETCQTNTACSITIEECKLSGEIPPEPLQCLQEKLSVIVTTKESKSSEQILRELSQCLQDRLASLQEQLESERSARDRACKQLYQKLIEMGETQMEAVVALESRLSRALEESVRTERTVCEKAEDRLGVLLEAHARRLEGSSRRVTEDGVVAQTREDVPWLYEVLMLLTDRLSAQESRLDDSATWAASTQEVLVRLVRRLDELKERIAKALDRPAEQLEIQEHLLGFQQEQDEATMQTRDNMQRLHDALKSVSDRLGAQEIQLQESATGDGSVQEALARLAGRLDAQGCLLEEAAGMERRVLDAQDLRLEHAARESARVEQRLERRLSDLGCRCGGMEDKLQRYAQCVASLSRRCWLVEGAVGQHPRAGTPRASSSQCDGRGHATVASPRVVLSPRGSTTGPPSAFLSPQPIVRSDGGELAAAAVAHASPVNCGLAAATTSGGGLAAVATHPTFLSPRPGIRCPDCGTPSNCHEDEFCGCCGRRHFEGETSLLNVSVAHRPQS